MSTAPQIATIRGIPIRLHLSIGVAVVFLVAKFGVLGVPAGLVLFGSLLVHELGHALVAARYGVPTAAIVVHLFGGVAMLEQPPRPRQEMWIAAAGPVASLVLGAGLALPAWLLGAQLDLVHPQPADLLAWGAALNLFMGAFNLLPALPMDGGRMLRAGLADGWGHGRATEVAGWVSRAFGAAFVVFGVVRGLWGLAAFGALLFVAVHREEQRARAVEAWRYGEGEAEAEIPFGLPRDARPSETVVDVTGGRVGETREEYVDGQGRRYVVVTKAVR